MQYATSCRSSLVECPHCSGNWASQDSLDAHLRNKNNQCCAIEQIPHTISIVQTCPMNLLGDNDDESASEIQVNYEGVQKKVTLERKSKFVLTKGSSSSKSSNQSSYASKILASYREDFLDRCQDPSMQMTINVQQVLQLTDMSSTDTLIANILLKTTMCKNGKIVVRSSALHDLQMEFKNTLVLYTMSGDIAFLPGAQQVSNDIDNVDFNDFLRRHCDLTTTIVNQHESSVDSESEQQEHGSMVYDVVMNNSFQDDFDNFNESNVSSEDEDSIMTENRVGEQLDPNMKYLQMDVCEARQTMVFDNSDVANLELYNLLKKASAPKYLFDKLIQWGKAHGPELCMNHGIQMRKTFIKNVGEKLYGKHFFRCSKPKQTNLLLPSGRHIPVTTFSMRTCIASILLDKTLMDPKNLLLDVDDPFTPQTQNGILDDLNSGWWHKETSLDICTHPNRDILLPLVFFIDGTVLDKLGKLSVEPVSFTLGILNRKTRNLPQAWRTLGYIEDFSNIVRANQEQSAKKVNPKTHLQDYHAMMEHILKDLQDLQGKDNGFAWNLQIGAKTYNVVFKIAVQVVIGDCKGNDYLCGRYGTHSLQVKKLCRDCKVCTMDGDNPLHVCRWITRDDIQGQSKKDLELLSFHKIQNAFDEVYFGARNLGINQATPPEPLHSFKLGLCKYLYEVLLSEMAPKTLRLMNSTIKIIIQRSGKQSVKDLPSLAPFRNGIDGCHTLTAKETYARIFALYLTLMDSKVFKSLMSQDRHIRTKDSLTGKMRFVSKGCIGYKDSLKWFKIIEDTLIFDAWMMKPSHDPHSVEPRIPDDVDDTFQVTTEHDSPALSRIRKYLTDYKSIVKRNTGNGLKLPKFHHHLHYPNQIRKDGSLQNIDGGRPESIGKPNAKNPGQLTQKHLKSLTKQLAMNYHNNLVLDEARRQFDVDKCAPDGKSNCKNGSQYTLTFGCSDYSNVDSYHINLKWKGSQVNEEISSHLCRCITRRLFLHTSEGGCLCKNSPIRGFTEYKHDDVVYRAHPSFRGEQEWFDWALIEWEEFEDPLPARIMMFLDLEDSQLMTTEEHKTFCDEMALHNHYAQDREGSYVHDRLVHHKYEYLTQTKWVVIEAALSQTELPDSFVNSAFRLRSKLANMHYLEENLRIVPIENIVGPAYCVGVPSTANGSTLNTKEDVVSLKDRTLWGDMFLE